MVTGFFGASATAQPPEDKQSGRRPGQGPPWAMARFLFQRFDEDRNSALEKEEVPGPVWDRLSAADADKDGSVTQREVIELAGWRVFENFDANEDDKLSADEVPELMWKRLSKADADEDGLVSFAEFVDTVLSAPRGGRPADAKGADTVRRGSAKRGGK